MNLPIRGYSAEQSALGGGVVHEGGREFFEARDEGKELLDLDIDYNHFMEFLRFPRQVVNTFPERRVTRENCRNCD